MTDDNQTRSGVLGSLTEVGDRLIGALPPAFLLLCVINIAFLGIVLWFLDNQIGQRTALVGKLLDRCMSDMAKIDDLGAMQARQDALEHDIRVLEAKGK
jgi:hypothetical protein